MFDVANTAGWKSQSLYDLAKWVNGLAFRDIQFSEPGLPIIKIAELKNGIANQTRFTNQIFDPSIKVQSGEMLFSWSGNPDTSIDVFRWNGPTGWLNQHIFKVTAKEQVADQFLYYVLKYLKPLFAEIARNKQTTGLGHVTVADLKRITIGLPLKSEQYSIAAVLGTLDDKINLNKAINETLESLARMLFEDACRGKTDGRIIPLPEVIMVNPPRTLRKGQIAPYLDMSNMPTASARALDVGEREYGSGARFMDGDTLVARITPCLENGKTAFVDFLGPGKVGWGSTEYLVFCPKPPLPAEFAYFLTRSEEFRNFAIANMNGSSGRQRVPAACFNQFPVFVPSPESLTNFGAFAREAFIKIRVNDEESRTLIALRDSLLPKLLSGEVRLPLSRENLAVS